MRLLLAIAVLLGPGDAAMQRLDGPGTLCGEAFALRLAKGEQAVRHDPDIDFLTYRIEMSDGPFILYEGNAPQRADDQIATGMEWPNVIAIHDNRAPSARDATSIRERLLLGPDRATLCHRKWGDPE